MKHLEEFWKLVKAFGYAVQPSLFSLVLLLLGAVVLVLVPQGKDAVLALADRGVIWRRLLFGIAALFWSVQTWYWARALYTLMDRDLSSNPSYRRKLGAYLPRLLGMSALLVVSFSLFRVAPHVYPRSQVLYWLAGLFFILSVLFFLFVTYRRDLKILKLPPLDNVIRQVNEESAGAQRATRFRDLPATTRKVLVFLSAASALTLLLFVLDPHLFTFQGGVALLILCISIWIPVGSWILYSSMKHRLPIFTLLLILAFVFRFWNDNHHVRVLKDKEPQRVALDDRIDAFLAKYPVVGEGEENEKTKPFYIVSAEGGGIRSAFWTASILTRIDQADPEFAKHLFAISSVSGGGLGASVYVTLLKERYQSSPFDLVTHSTRILERDFLSPTITAMLCGDLVQRFLPFSIPYLCRGRALERAWEIAWEKAFPNSLNRYQEPFTSLWKNDKLCQIPLLFLNSTMVESGYRVISSFARIQKNHFSESIDVYDLTSKEMRLSTVVGLSSRFPYISPAATFDDGYHVVDGGYFDDSATLTAMDILLAVKRRLEKNPRQLQLVVIEINNYLESTAEIPRQPPIPFWEVTAPLQTLVTVHRSHANHFKKRLQNLAKTSGAAFVKFVPWEEQLEFPLGWTLSAKVRELLSNQAEHQVCKIWLSK
jgi:hypothetical protein